MASARADDFDAIVIGSGVGGLSAASSLAQVSRSRVLVLEQHSEIGGFNRTVIRGARRWDAGLTALGNIPPESLPRRAIDFVTRGDVEWEPLTHPPETYHFPDGDFTFPHGSTAMREFLHREFPESVAEVDRFFRDIERALAWTVLEGAGTKFSLPAKAAMLPGARRHRGLALTTLGDYLEAHISDPRLAGVLASHCWAYGLSPKRAAFAQHAAAMTHFAQGAWYPVGGSAAITSALVAAITDAGGAVRVGRRVDEILVEGKRAVGVRVTHNGLTRELRARTIISAAGARATLGRLLPMGATPTAVRDRVLPIPSAGPCVMAYVGLRTNPSDLGFVSSTEVFFDDWDHDGMVARSHATLDGFPPTVAVTFPSMRDRFATEHTAMVLTPVPASAFAQWSGVPAGERGPHYEAVTASIVEGSIDLLDRERPGFARSVESIETVTPVDITEMTGYPFGGIVDLAGTPERFAVRLPVTLLPGLHLAGVDTTVFGIMGAVFSGLAAAGAAQGRFGTERLFLQVSRPARKARHAAGLGELGVGSDSTSASVPVRSSL